MTSNEAPTSPIMEQRPSAYMDYQGMNIRNQAERKWALGLQVGPGCAKGMVNDSMQSSHNYFGDELTIVENDGALTSPNVVKFEVLCLWYDLKYFWFKDGDKMEDIVDREKGKNSMLTAFFKKNKEDSNARKYLYKDFPKHFTWNRSNHCWRIREHKSMIGRLVYANPAEGERYYLRLLLCHITGPTFFEDLYTANGVLHPTFRKATLERGLIETDDNLSQCLVEASLFQFPSALRRLFATMLIFCEPGNVRKLWDDHYDSLSEDYRKQYGCVERVQNMVLIDIRVVLESMSKKLSDYDLPNDSAHIDLQSRGYREVQEEYSINVENEDLLARDSLNPD
ncbi:unnamed protein product [Lactuca virosa]|uniref:ATP-dependent DNA helicase n=1 Tax=Lactuca virosa TaxID=75947 RepID=A0AAU9N606_9ASTR|nr:unnamed protein product [Lactuca virosa]